MADDHKEKDENQADENQKDENQADEMTILSTPLRFLEEIAIDLQIKKESEERAKKFYEAIAAAPPLKRVDPYVTILD